VSSELSRPTGGDSAVMREQRRELCSTPSVLKRVDKMLKARLVARLIIL